MTQFFPVFELLLMNIETVLGSVLLADYFAVKILADYFAVNFTVFLSALKSASFSSVLFRCKIQPVFDTSCDDC